MQVRIIFPSCVCFLQRLDKAVQVHKGYCVFWVLLAPLIHIWIYDGARSEILYVTANLSKKNDDGDDDWESEIAKEEIPA